MSVKAGVSVIICCYNSEKRIPETIRHLCRQQVPPAVPWEVIVVNNGCTDQTVELSRKTWEEHRPAGIDFTIVEQSQPGLSNARQKGFEMARYEFMLLCDDDNWLFPEYIHTTFEIMTSSVHIGILGGQGFAKTEIQAPAWFKEHQLYYAVGKPSEQSGDITRARGDVYGAGATVRRSILMTLQKDGFKSILSDRTGTELLSGGDNEICIVLKLSGSKIWYDERLKFYHFIPKERLTTTYLIKLKQGIARSFCLMRPYHHIQHINTYLNRPWFKKHWLWFLLTRVIYSFIKLDFILIARYHIYKNLNDKTLDAFGRTAYMKTILQEKKNMNLHLQQIINSPWFNKRCPTSNR